jgi:hypothetical protein
LMVQGLRRRLSRHPQRLRKPGFAPILVPGCAS